MKFQNINLETGKWQDTHEESRWIHVVTGKATFDLQEADDGGLQIRLVSGRMSIDPQAANYVVLKPRNGDDV